MILEFSILSTVLLLAGLALLVTAVWDAFAIADRGTIALVFGRSSRVVVSVLLLVVGLAISLDLSWMRWTPATGTFFVGLFSLLVVMTMWDRVSPTKHHKGFLPIPFSRGERLFLSFMIFFGVMGLWMAFLPDVSLWFGIGVAAVLIVITAKFG